jgi:3-methyladenine DNA glycosylase AlkD
MPHLRQLARSIGKPDHVLAQDLWETGLHEARFLATLVNNPGEVTVEQMERWVADFDSWDLCDQCCGNLFDKTAYAWEKATEWRMREREYEKRARFVLFACLAVLDKKAPDNAFLPYPAIIKHEAGESRNFV